MPLTIPTNVSEQQIREYQFLMWKHKRIKLTYLEARREAIQFLQFMTVIIDGNEAFYD